MGWLYQFTVNHMNAGETVVQFVVRLKQQTRLRKFSTTERSNEDVPDHLVVSLLNVELKKKLLRLPELTITKALEEARLWETTAQQATSMGPGTSSAGAHAVSEKRASSAGRPRESVTGTSKRDHASACRCFACNHASHFSKSPSSTARDRSCKKCGQKGHFAVCCTSKARPTHHVEGHDHGVDQPDNDRRGCE